MLKNVKLLGPKYLKVLSVSLTAVKLNWDINDVVYTNLCKAHFNLSEKFEFQSVTWNDNNYY